MAVQPEQVHDSAVIDQKILRVWDHPAAASVAEEESSGDLFDAAEFPHRNRRPIGTAVVFVRPGCDQGIGAVGPEHRHRGRSGSQEPGFEQGIGVQIDIIGMVRFDAVAAVEDIPSAGGRLFPGDFEIIDDLREVESPGIRPGPDRVDRHDPVIVVIAVELPDQPALFQIVFAAGLPFK